MVLVAVKVPPIEVPVAVTAKYVTDPLLLCTSRRLAPIALEASRIVRAPRVASTTISGFVEALYACWRFTPLALLPQEATWLEPLRQMAVVPVEPKVPIDTPPLA